MARRKRSADNAITTSVITLIFIYCFCLVGYAMGLCYAISKLAFN